MAGVTVGTIVTASLLNLIGSETNAFFGVPFWWHCVLGGWAFGMVFMATDPVSSPAPKDCHEPLRTTRILRRYNFR